MNMLNVRHSKRGMRLQCLKAWIALLEEELDGEQFNTELYLKEADLQTDQIKADLDIEDSKAHEE